MISRREYLESSSSLRSGAPRSTPDLVVEANDQAASPVGHLEPLLGLLVGLAAWEVAGRALHYSFLPPLSSVLGAVPGLIAHDRLLEYLGASLMSLMIGYLLSASSGVALGLLMGRYRALGYAVEPFISALLAAPKLAFVPLLFALFGAGRGAQVSVVFMNAFFIIAISTMDGIRSVNASYVDMARTFGATERQVFWKVLLPATLPTTMAGLRVGVIRAVKGMVKGEMFIAVFGVGALLRRYGSRFDSERVYAILLVIIIIALVCSVVMGQIERRVAAWTECRS